MVVNPQQGDAAIEDEVPGTVYLIDEQETVEGVKRDGDVVLHPTPSDDPQDPLNWSKKRKWVNSITLQFYTFIIGAGSATGYSTYPYIIANTGIPLATLNSAVGVLFLMFGWGTLLWCPIGLQYGRRGVYIISCIGCTVMNLWAPYTTTVGTWYAHRFLYGFFGAPIEALVEQSMTDIFFTHERGTHIGWFMVWLGGCSYVTPIASAYVAQNMNWKWCFYFPAVFTGLTAILLFFVLDESMYDRALMRDNAERRAAEARANIPDASAEDPAMTVEAIKNFEASSTDEPATLRYEQLTWWQRRRLFTVVPNKKNVILPMMIRSLKLAYEFPIIAMSGFQNGLFLMMFTILNGTWTTIFGGSPYNFTGGTVGLMYIGPFIGSLIGGLYSGRFADWYHNWAARRNGGVREPEQRLVLYVMATVTLTVGNLLYGVGSANGIHWIGVVIGGGIVCIAGVVCGASPIAYISDSYRDLTGEGMITMTIIRDTMGFAASYAITPWVEAEGIQNTFLTVAMLAFGLSLTFFPFIWFGKAERRRTAAKYYKYAASATVSH
ncbi:hypothetical protein N7510_006369 [Penicillium lagena]|uniref:uncharacterized protein n=1 Tax=Penicillium lagena TaxID=94218 RepID=UPI00254101A3|nr:uncharacterized protein N7510_006369 [Penicillium lagena]KAJ5613175.1 hypothetical protein N7510_006369 [Penicillium lagena]